MFHRRTVGLALCAAAIGAILLACISHDWWRYQVHDDTQIAVGLRSASVCVGEHAVGYLAREHRPDGPNGGCFHGSIGTVAGHLTANRDIYIIDDLWNPSRGRSIAAFTVAGTLVFGLGLAVLVVLAALAALTFWRSDSAWLDRLATLATVGAAGFVTATVVLVILAPAQIDRMPLGLGLACALGGGACALAAGLVLEPMGEATRPARSPRVAGEWRALAAAALGVTAVLFAVQTRSWWREDDGTLHARAGLQDGETCVGDETVTCEAETWDAPPTGATGPRERADHIAFRAAEAAYQLGTLAVGVAALACVLLVLGARIPGAWSPQGALLACTLGFAVATVILVLGRAPSTMDPAASLSSGPWVALAGAGALIWSAIEMIALARRP